MHTPAAKPAPFQPFPTCATDRKLHSYCHSSPFGKRTKQWNIPMLNGKIIFQGSIFHCYVSLQKCSTKKKKKTTLRISQEEAVRYQPNMDIQHTPPKINVFPVCMSYNFLGTPRESKNPIKRRSCMSHPLRFLMGHRLRHRMVFCMAWFKLRSFTKTTLTKLDELSIFPDQCCRAMQKSNDF